MYLKRRLTLLIVAILYTIAPILLALLGLGLASLFGCTTEIIEFICKDNHFFSGLITYLVFAHWFAMLTIPTGLLATLIILIGLIKQLLQRKKR